MAARNDIHRPSAIEPSEYQFVAFDYLPSNPGDIGAAMFLAEERKRKAAHMARTGGSYSQHEHGGLCHICGSVNAIYSASFWHQPSNVYIKTGLDCAQKLECHGIEAFRKNVKKALEANAGKRKAKAILDKAGLGAAWALYEADIAKRKAYAEACKAWRDAGGGDGDDEDQPRYAEPSRDEYTVLDIVSRLIKWGDISEKASAFLGQLLERINNAPAREAEKAAAKAAEMVDAKPVPVSGGRMMVKGEVLSIKQQESAFGLQIKMLVKVEAEGGGWFKLWGTVPSAIVEGLSKGDIVQFVAGIQRSDNDEFFGFFSRPAQAKVIKQGVAA